MNEPGWNDDDAQSDEDTTVPCPYCRRLIYDDSLRCPYCGNYLSDEDMPEERKPWWVYVGVLLALYVVFRWIAG